MRYSTNENTLTFKSDDTDDTLNTGDTTGNVYACDTDAIISEL